MLRIRLTRTGKKKQASYRVVVADKESKRDGRIVERIGHYDPLPDPIKFEIEEARALYWLSVGAQPSGAVRRLLEKQGTLDRLKRLHAGETLEALVAEYEGHAPDEEEAEAEEAAPVAEAEAEEAEAAAAVETEEEAAAATEAEEAESEESEAEAEEETAADEEEAEAEAEAETAADEEEAEAEADEEETEVETAVETDEESDEDTDDDTETA